MYSSIEVAVCCLQNIAVPKFSLNKCMYMHACVCVCVCLFVFMHTYNNTKDKYPSSSGKSVLDVPFHKSKHIKAFDCINSPFNIILKDYGLYTIQFRWHLYYIYILVFIFLHYTASIGEKIQKLLFRYMLHVE